MRASGAIALLLLVNCVPLHDYYHLDLPDVNLPNPPADLDVSLKRYRSGEEKRHGDPKAVADTAIRTWLDVPWKADPFNPRYYEVKENEKWGTHVVRGYKYPSGGEMRYRVKVRRHEEIWYPIQVSRYKVVQRPGEDGHDHAH
jgi:hypothetical protein